MIDKRVYWIRNPEIDWVKLLVQIGSVLSFLMPVMGVYLVVLIKPDREYYPYFILFYGAKALAAIDLLVRSCLGQKEEGCAAGSCQVLAFVDMGLTLLIALALIDENETWWARYVVILKTIDFLLFTFIALAWTKNGSCKCFLSGNRMANFAYSPPPQSALSIPIQIQYVLVPIAP